MTHVIKVTTFKPSGKYYDKWNIEVSTETNTWYEIIEAVRSYKQIAEVQSSMDWLIGMDDSRDDMYPILLKE